MERFDKGDDFNNFWDIVLAHDEFNEDDRSYFRKLLESRPLDNPQYQDNEPSSFVYDDSFSDEHTENIPFLTNNEQRSI